MISDADGRRLRVLEEQLMVDDAEFVVAFRSRSSLMPDARQLQADLRVLGECLMWTLGALVLLLLTRGAYAGTAGLLLLLFPVVLGRSRRPIRGNKLAGRRRRLRSRPSSRSS